MARLNQWKADPDKYAKLSEPFQDRAEADRACTAFIEELSRLREKYHIPELVCQLQVYIKTEMSDAQAEESATVVETMVGGAGWGNQLKQARLAQRMADHEMDSALRMMEDLAVKSATMAAYLITDPGSAADPLSDTDETRDKN